MSNALWKIVLKETFLSADILALLIVPVLAAVIAIIVFKRSPLKSTEAWRNVGRRYMTLGFLIAGSALAIYLLSIAFAYMNRVRDNDVYTKSLQIKFRDASGCGLAVYLAFGLDAARRNEVDSLAVG